MDETSLWLTPFEVEELTAVKRHSAQCRALARMNIPFLPNAIGRPLVERAVVIKSKALPRPPARTEPNWAALEEMRARSEARRARR